MKPALRWTILAAVLVLVAGIVLLKNGTSPTPEGDRPVVASVNPEVTPKAALPRLLELHGGAG
jgi:hypothetical protein